VVDKNGKPYLYFKGNATSKAKGKSAWIISLREFKNDKEKWLAVYHLRSIIESVFSSIKKRWGSFLHSRKKRMQRKELALKVDHTQHHHKGRHYSHNQGVFLSCLLNTHLIDTSSTPNQKLLAI